jgi:hypothetical protein
MEKLDRSQFSVLLKKQRIKPRLVRELRFVPEDIASWDDLELLAITTRSKSEGLLLVQIDDFYVIPYELAIGLKDNTTGRSRPVVCDFCYTWQQGGKVGRITFRRISDDHTFTYLCCADLQCSQHVRNKTAEATLSRAQLHEDITVEQRITRLRVKIGNVIKTLGVQPVLPDGF